MTLPTKAIRAGSGCDEHRTGVTHMQAETTGGNAASMAKNLTIGEKTPERQF